MPLGCQTKLQQKEQLLYIDLIPVKLRANGQDYSLTLSCPRLICRCVCPTVGSQETATFFYYEEQLS